MVSCADPDRVMQLRMPFFSFSVLDIPVLFTDCLGVILSVTTCVPLQNTWIKHAAAVSGNITCVLLSVEQSDYPNL